MEKSSSMMGNVNLNPKIPPRARSSGIGRALLRIRLRRLRVSRVLLCGVASSAPAIPPHPRNASAASPNRFMHEIQPQHIEIGLVGRRIALADHRFRRFVESLLRQSFSPKIDQPSALCA